jgi:hypothetical protein
MFLQQGIFTTCLKYLSCLTLVYLLIIDAEDGKFEPSHPFYPRLRVVFTLCAENSISVSPMILLDPAP